MEYLEKERKTMPLWDVGFGLGSSVECGTWPLRHHHPWCGDGVLGAASSRFCKQAARFGSSCLGQVRGPCWGTNWWVGWLLQPNLLAACVQALAHSSLQISHLNVCYRRVCLPSMPRPGALPMLCKSYKRSLCGICSKSVCCACALLAARSVPWLLVCRPLGPCCTPTRAPLLCKGVATNDDPSQLQHVDSTL